MTPRPKPEDVARETACCPNTCKVTPPYMLRGGPESHVKTHSALCDTLTKKVVRALWQAETAALERAREIARLQNNYIDTKVGTRQQWVRDQIVEKIDALIEPEPKG